jgi:hypothetical protein
MSLSDCVVRRFPTGLPVRLEFVQAFPAAIFALHRPRNGAVKHAAVGLAQAGPQGSPEPDRLGCVSDAVMDLSSGYQLLLNSRLHVRQ